VLLEPPVLSPCPERWWLHREEVSLGSSIQHELLLHAVFALLRAEYLCLQPVTNHPNFQIRRVLLIQTRAKVVNAPKDPSTIKYDLFNVTQDSSTLSTTCFMPSDPSSNLYLCFIAVWKLFNERMCICCLGSLHNLLFTGITITVQYVFSDCR
jgi:hypothetical protein